MSQAAFETQRVINFCSNKLVELKQKATEDRAKWITEHIEYKKKQKASWYGFLITVPTEEELLKSQRISWFLPWENRDIQRTLELCQSCNSSIVFLDMENVVRLRRFGLDEGQKTINALGIMGEENED